MSSERMMTLRPVLSRRILKALPAARYGTKSTQAGKRGAHVHQRPSGRVNSGAASITMRCSRCYASWPPGALPRAPKLPSGTQLCVLRPQGEDRGGLGARATVDGLRSVSLGMLYRPHERRDSIEHEKQERQKETALSSSLASGSAVAEALSLKRAANLA